MNMAAVYMATTSLLDLDSDVLDIIFSLLDKKTLIKVARVCHQLRDTLYCNQRIWRQSVARFRVEDFDSQTAESFKERGVKAIMLINSHRGDGVNLPELKGALKHCAETVGTEMLILKDIDMTLHYTYLFPETFSALKCLTIHSGYHPLQFSFRGLEKALKQLVNLKQLKIFMDKYTVTKKDGGYTFIPFNFLIAISMSVSTLEDLQIQPKVLLKNTLAFFNKKFSKLKRLDICIPLDKCVFLLEALQQDELENFQHLKLELLKKHDKADVRMCRLDFKDLKSLSLSGEEAPRLFSTVFGFGEGCPKLQAFKLSSYSNEGFGLFKTDEGVFESSVARLASNCPCLVVVDLSKNATPSNALQHFVSKMPNLVTVLLQCYSITKANKQTIEKGLESAAADLAQLVSITNAQSVGVKKYTQLFAHTSVKYIVDVGRFHRQYSVLKLSDSASTGWEEVAKGSDCWHEALGTHYYMPKDSYDTMRMIRKNGLFEKETDIHA